MPWFPNPNGGAPIQAATNPNPAGGSLGLYSDPSYSGPPPSGASQPAATPNTPASSTTSTSATGDAAAAQLGQIQNSINQALASGNKAAFDEAVRQFNATFGLDTQKFQEAVTEYNQNFGLSQAGVTGTYQGAPTLAAQQQAANIAAQAAGLTGYYTAPSLPGAAPGSAAPAASGGISSGLPPGTVVRTAANQFGVVGANGLITPGDVTNPTIYAAIQANQGIRTLPDAQFAGAIAQPAPQPAQPAPVAGTAPGTVTPGVPVQTLAGQQQQFAQQQASQQQQFAQQQASTLQNATLSGLQANGQPTEATRQFNLTQGLAGLTLASNLQPNAFRQAQALYGLGQNGETPLMAAAAGTGKPVTAFQAPTLSAADTATLPWLASQTGGNTYTANQATDWMNALPGPQAVNWTAVGQAGPGATDLVTQGLAQKYGLAPTDIQAIQKQAMPGFSAPSLAGTFKG